MKHEYKILKVIYKNNSLLAAQNFQILFILVLQKFGPLYKYLWYTFSVITDFLSHFLLSIMTSSVIDLHILEYHAQGETTKLSDLKIMERYDVVDLRATIQE